MCIYISTYTYLQVANGTPKGWKNLSTVPERATKETGSSENTHKTTIKKTFIINRH